MTKKPVAKNVSGKPEARIPRAADPAALDAIMRVVRASDEEVEQVRIERLGEKTECSS